MGPAAAAADDCLLTHKETFGKSREKKSVRQPFVQSHQHVSDKVSAGSTAISMSATGRSESSPSPNKNDKSNKTFSGPKCFYCHRRGHVMSKCWELTMKVSNKPVAAFQSQLSDDLAHCVYENSGMSAVSSEGCNIPGDPSCCPVSGRVVPHDVMDNYKGFVSVGEVSVVGDASMASPITILRDTGAAQSMMLDHILPELNMEPSKSHVLLEGFWR